MSEDDIETLKTMHILALLEKVCEDEIARLEDELPSIKDKNERRNFLLIIDTLNAIVDRANANAEGMIDEFQQAMEIDHGKLH